MNREALVIIGTFTPPLHGNMEEMGRLSLLELEKREGDRAKWLIHGAGVEQLSRHVALLGLVFIAVAAWPGKAWCSRNICIQFIFHFNNPDQRQTQTVCQYWTVDW